jgi:hypothetical protein
MYASYAGHRIRKNTQRETTWCFSIYLITKQIIIFYLNAVSGLYAYSYAITRRLKL